MYRDNDLIHSLAQAVTTGTEVSTIEYTDHGAAGNAYDKELFWLVRVDTAFTVGTSLKVDLQTCAEPTFASPTILDSTGVVLEAALTANTVIRKSRVPLGLLRYSRTVYTTVGTHSTGTIDSEFVMDVEYQR
jgi:hypothetical protein